MRVLPERLQGAPLLVLSSLLFAVMAVSARMVAGRVSVGQTVSARFLLGLLGLGGYALSTGWRPRAPQPGKWALRGLFGGVAVHLYFLAIDRLPVGLAVLLNTCWPLCAAVLGLAFLKERLTGYLMAGLALTTSGVGLVVWSTVEHGLGAVSLVGLVGGALSAVLSGAAVVVMRALRRDTDAPTILLSFCLFGLLCGLPFAVQDWRPVTPQVLGPLFVMGVASLAAQLLFTHALGFVTAAVSGIIQQLVPAFSWALGALLLGEPTGPLAVAGALVCMVGVLWGTGVVPRLLLTVSRPSA